MTKLVTRPQLRRILQEALRTEMQFSAFVMDYFSEVYSQFTSGMDRLSRTNLLLESLDAQIILDALLVAQPELAVPLEGTAASTAASTAPERPTEAWPSGPPHYQSTMSAATKIAPLTSQFILHLSDLHFTNADQVAQWHTQLLLDLRNQLRIKQLAAVLLSGDITNHATAAQFAAAQGFIEQFSRSFRVQPNRIAIVPGNHDVSWDLARMAYKEKPALAVLFKKPEPETMYVDNGKVYIRNDSNYSKRFERFSAFYLAICGLEYPLDYAQQATVQHFPELNLLVLGLNSAWYTDHAFPQRACLHAAAFGHALGQIATNESYERCTKLALWHHPPSALTLEGGGLDGAVLQQLAQAGFRLVVHGHVHRADNSSFRYYRSSPFGAVEILTAGTFGAPTHELVSGYPFQYQILELADDLLTVHTRKREDVSGGWVPDYRWQQGPGQSPLASYKIPLH